MATIRVPLEQYDGGQGSVEFSDDGTCVDLTLNSDDESIQVSLTPPEARALGAMLAFMAGEVEG